jgi:uncharacterized protein YlzI (FlbEa/FlbD family)
METSDNPCSANSTQHVIALNRLDTPHFGVNSDDVAKVHATPNYVCAIVTSSVFIVLAHIGHVIGLLYVDYVLMSESGLNYFPTLYLEAIPGFIMVLMITVPFMCLKPWKAWLLGAENTDEDTRPITIILSFVHSV